MDVPTLGMREAQDVIVAEMAAYDDWLGKYEYLVGQGRRVGTSDPKLRTDRYSVAGCQSSLWIRTRLLDGCVRISADSDAAITRGIIGLLIRVLDGRTPREILDGDLYFLDETGLRAHLSPARANGLAVMLRRVTDFAAGVAGDFEASTATAPDVSDPLEGDGLKVK